MDEGEYDDDDDDGQVRVGEVGEEDGSGGLFEALRGVEV